MNTNKYFLFLFFLAIWIILYLTLYKIFYFDYIQIKTIRTEYIQKKTNFYANLINNQTCRIDILNKNTIDKYIIDIKNNKKIFTTIDKNNICTCPENLMSIIGSNMLFNFLILFSGFIISFLFLDFVLNIFIQNSIIKIDDFYDIEMNSK